MAITLIVEDGSNVANANTFGDLAGFKVWADNRNISYPDDDEETKAHLIKAMDYIESKESQFKGYRSYSDQPLSFPRENIRINGINVGGAIPLQVISAQYQLAVDSIAAGTEGLNPSTDGRFVTRKKIEGAVEVEFSERGGSGSSPNYVRAEQTLSFLYRNGSGLNFPIVG